MKKTYFQVIAFAVTLLSSQLLWAAAETDQSMPTKNYHHQHEISILYSKLNLSLEQKNKIYTIKHETRTELKAIKQQLKTIQMQLTNLENSESMDMKKIDELLAKKSKLKLIVIKAQAVMRHKIFYVLDDKQKMQLQEMLRNIAAKHP